MASESLAKYYEIVEEAIRELGVNPVVSRGEKPGQWDLKRGSATIWVDVFYIDKNEAGYFQALSPIVKVPEDGDIDMFKELLEINHTFYGVAFTLYKDWVYVKAIREVNGLDQSEVLAMLNRIGFYADEWDDKLKEKYLKE